MVSVEVHTAIDEVEREWEAVSARAGASPFLRPDWTRAWWRAFGRGSLEVFALRRDGRLVAFAPLYRLHGRLRSTTNAHTPEYGLVAEDDAAAGALADAVVSHAPRRLELAFLDAAQAGGLWQTAAESAGYRTAARNVLRSPYLEIETDWGVYERSLPPAFRSEIRRRLRRLGEQGELRLEMEDGRGDLDRLLEEGFRLEGSGWKAKEGTAIESSPQTAGFYRELARSAATHGHLQLAFLRLDGRPLAFSFGLQDAGVYYTLKSGYDPTYRQLAPGIVLRYELLKHAFADRLERVEFLGADEPSKLIWTKTTRDRAILQAFRQSPLGLLEWAAAAHGRPLAKRAGLARVLRRRR
jgi:CelD/BcsL family acetyltransferase involved in cellulose biosynthesis